MGPPTNVDGEPARAPSASQGKRRFNGAADKRRRRGAVADMSGAAKDLASMGPPTNVDGEW